MEDLKVNGGWSKLFACLFIAGGVLSILIPAFVHWGLLPVGFDSPWVFYAFVAGIGLCFAASLGFFIHAKLRNVEKLEFFFLGALAFLIGSFWIYLLTLFL